MTRPLLVVLAGRPGTGKTTLAVALARELAAACVRIDSIVDALHQTGLTVDLPSGAAPAYPVARNVAASTLQVRTSVVVDAVNPSHEERALWPPLAAEADARLIVLETVLPDSEEHRRRVESRHVLDQRAASWSTLEAKRYDPWDKRLDGPCSRVDATDRDGALRTALHHCLRADEG
jgi:predicted kinase